MRTDAAERQNQALEKILAKALINLDVPRTEQGAHAMANLMGAMLETYLLGALEALQASPWETCELMYRDVVTPERIKPMTLQGWEPWALTNVMVPPDPRRLMQKMPPAGEPTPGWMVKYKRRMPPLDLPAPETAGVGLMTVAQERGRQKIAEPPPDTDHSRGG